MAGGGGHLRGYRGWKRPGVRLGDGKICPYAIAGSIDKMVQHSANDIAGERTSATKLDSKGCPGCGNRGKQLLLPVTRRSAATRDPRGVPETCNNPDKNGTEL